MWQTKYASAVPRNLGLGLNFWMCSEGYLPWVSVVCGVHKFKPNGHIVHIMANRFELYNILYARFP